MHLYGLCVIQWMMRWVVLSVTCSGCDELAATRADSARIQGHLFIHGHTTEYTVGGGGWGGHIKGKKKRKNVRKGNNTNKVK